MTKPKVQVRNVLRPGASAKAVDAAKYAAMKQAFLAVLPASPPGLTIAQIHEQLPARLAQELFPSGAAATWWAKTVQLDLEAKSLVKRANTRPLRLHRARP